MLTKKSSLWISLAVGIVLMAAMVIFAIRPQAKGFGGQLESWLIFTPVLLLVTPLLVPRSNTAYGKHRLSLTTSIMQYAFFALCLVFGAALLVSTNLLLNLVLLAGALVALIALVVKSCLVDWGDNRRNSVLKAVIAVLTFTVVAWLPVSLLLNPGWGTLLIYSPYALIAVVPLLLLVANTTRARHKLLPLSVFVAEVLFLLLWASIGFWYVNGGDTDESIGSLASKLLGGIFGRDFLIQLSPIALKLSVCIALALLPYIFLYKQGASKIIFKTVPAVLSVLGIVACVWILSTDNAKSHSQAQALKGAVSIIQRNILSSTSGSRELTYNVTGDGLLAQLRCSHRATCPSVVTTWAVPVRDGTEWDFAWGLVQKSGYINPDPIFPCSQAEVDQNGCGTWGLKNGSELWVTIKELDPSETPKTSVAPKTWRLIRIEADPYDLPAPTKNGAIYPALDFPAQY